MAVLRMHLMPVGGLAFVVVTFVPSMKVTVVQVIDVITVRDCNMSAAFAVNVRVLDVFVVNCLSHCFITTVSTRFCLLSVRAQAHFTGRPAVCSQKRLATSRCRESPQLTRQKAGRLHRWLWRARPDRRCRL
jgi:hypothetical protein